jgi:predicted SAM-dependent methyltransferase
MPLLMKALNIGCGLDIRPGWVNLDRVALPGVDVVHDLAKLPLPFPADSFQRVDCLDIFEHIDYIPLVRDIHRMLVPGGSVFIRVPHFTSRDSYGDPTHRKLFAVDTLRFFAKGQERSYYFDFAFSKVDIRLHFSKRAPYFYNYPLEWAVNRSARMLNLYECSPLRIFPATNLEATLVK